MVPWLFQIRVSRWMVSDLQIPEGVAADGGSTLVLRLIFDGKVVNLAFPSKQQVPRANRRTSFKYRVGADSLRNLVATLSQRTAVFQIILIDGSEKEVLVGLASTSLLQLVRKVGAQCSFQLVPPGEVSQMTTVGQLSMLLFMEQIGDVELRIKEVRASGLDAGEYKLRCQLSSCKTEAWSALIRPKSGCVSWQESMPLKLVFTGTLRTLAAQQLDVTLFRVCRNGLKMPASTLSVDLAKLQEDSKDVSREISFGLESDKTPVSVFGILELLQLPIFHQQVDQMLESPCILVCEESNEKGKSVSSGGTSVPLVGVLSSPPLRACAPETCRHQTPSGSPAFASGASIPPLHIQEPTQNSRENGGKESSYNETSMPQGGDRAIPEATSPVAQLRKKDFEGDRSECAQQQGSCPQQPGGAAVAPGALLSVCHVVGPSEAVEGEKIHRTSCGSVCEINNQYNEDCSNEEMRLGQELDRLNERIAFLSKTLKEILDSSEAAKETVHARISMWEQQLMELDREEASLVEISNQITEQMQLCFSWGL
ncbi:hypothetical protein DQ04_02601070 [Trypanosoma grayi]|uniref:hypothetical protein n=1 Tax=Trypanosoma grayi TaxID=71804 RepID=UPI0004F4B432|nr:hypothetical protein DQ04_02601070 [Trypanosoma grayi]KEG11460.1 hypothetical protein DQ04_02601070 [Trypanosoma grayi]